MDFFQTLYSRRTIRTYNGKPVSDAQLQEILKAGYAAPIGRRRYDTLHLTVITDRDFLADWEKQVGMESGKEDAHPFYGAPTVILVSSVVDAEPYGNVNYSNAAIVVQNMALAACELGVGACHIWGAVRTLNNSPDLLARLPIPAGMVPVCSVALGRTDETYSLREIPVRLETSYL
jgi:nitroreductase